MEERPPIGRVAANVLNNSRGQAARGDPAGWGLGKRLTTPHRENVSLLRNIHRQSLELLLILWYNLSNERETRDLVLGMLGACVVQVHLEQQSGN
jgi:hypothetical protein